MFDRLAKPTSMSVTSKPCRCHYLEQRADDPLSPIVYDPELCEYNFQHSGPHGVVEDGPQDVFIRIYHCPMCGGAAPKSKRELLFATISPQEERRLSKLIAPLKSLDDALRTLGPPSEDYPAGFGTRQPERNGQPPTIEAFRMLRYASLSEVADVNVAETRTGGIQYWLQGKYLGPVADGKSIR